MAVLHQIFFVSVDTWRFELRGLPRKTCQSIYAHSETRVLQKEGLSFLKMTHFLPVVRKCDKKRKKRTNKKQDKTGEREKKKQLSSMVWDCVSCSPKGETCVIDSFESLNRSSRLLFLNWWVANNFWLLVVLIGLWLQGSFPLFNWKKGISKNIYLQGKQWTFILQDTIQEFIYWIWWKVG